MKITPLLLLLLTSCSNLHRMPITNLDYQRMLKEDNQTQEYKPLEKILKKDVPYEQKAKLNYFKAIQ